MKVHEGLHLLRSYEDSVNSYWNFYALVSLAIVGFVLQAGKDLTPESQYVLAFGYFLFATTNLWRLSHAQNLYNAMKKVVAEYIKSDDESTPLLLSTIEKYKPLVFKQYGIFHIALDIFVALIIVTVN